MEIKTLKYFPITHAGIQRVFNPKIMAETNGRTVLRYLRFLRPVKLDHLELKPFVKVGRSVPRVPSHPAHLVISFFDEKSGSWQEVKSVDLDPDPRIWGEGLSQSMSDDEMSHHFAAILKDPLIWRVDLDGLETKTLRVECDREHPIWPNHCECNGEIFSVPFQTLDSLEAFGTEGGTEMPFAKYNPILKRSNIQPEAPTGMTVSQLGEMILYQSPKLSVGFALHRPIMLHLGWDDFEAGHSSLNRLGARRVYFQEFNRSMSGPVLISNERDFGSHHWTGTISIKGNVVSYGNLKSIPGLTIDANFTVEEDRIFIELIQTAEENISLIEAETWRFTFAMSKGMTGIGGIPTLRSGRSGEVSLPSVFAGDGNGALVCRLVEGNPEDVHLQVESYRSSREVAVGLVLNKESDGVTERRIPAGRQRAVVSLQVMHLKPETKQKEILSKAGQGVRRHWGSVLSCYRPEFGGFSNNAVSTHCHVNQHGCIELVSFTADSVPGFKAIETARFTIDRALMDGGGYGYWRNLYLDADPVVVAAAGRIHQTKPDLKWLRSVEPGLRPSVERMVANIDSTGLVVCKDLSGNTGSHRWSSNAWDNVGFGHLDSYVNAWVYRALRNAAALFEDLGDKDLSNRCRDKAKSIRTHFADNLVNPETGWVMSWRSRDNEVHDYASPWINGAACAFGLLDHDRAVKALKNLEKLRRDLGLESARLGVPFAMKPLHPGDHIPPARQNAGRIEPTFEFFTDGSIAPSAAAYYLRALSTYGLTREAEAITADLDESFAAGLFTGSGGGSSGTGNEFFSWEGLTSAYEGTFVATFAVLYAMAITQGALDPPEPEWWPENG